MGVSERRVVPFPTTGADPAQSPAQLRRRRPARDAERATGSGRRLRRRHSTPWLQRHALSIAAVAVLVSLLSVGFTLMQLLTRPEQAPAMATVAGLVPAPEAATNSLTTTGVQTAAVVPPLATVPRPREIVSSSRILEPTYTVEAGDTLNRIAERFGTSVQRIQALNDLADPRTLRIGARLVIPPPF